MGVEISDVVNSEELLPPESRPIESADVTERAKPQAEERAHVKFGKRKLDAIDTEMVKLLQSEDDEYDSFGKVVACKLRKISDSNRREYLRLQQSIGNLIFDCELDITL